MKGLFKGSIVVLNCRASVISDLGLYRGLNSGVSGFRVQGLGFMGSNAKLYSSALGNCVRFCITKLQGIIEHIIVIAF